MGVAISGGILIVFPYLPVEFNVAVAISVSYGLILSPYQVKTNKTRYCYFICQGALKIQTGQFQSKFRNSCEMLILEEVGSIVEP